MFDAHEKPAARAVQRQRQETGHGQSFQRQTVLQQNLAVEFDERGDWIELYPPEVIAKL
jgi:hypothetical protein